MDCSRAREIISEAFDRGVTEVPLSAEARDHCRDCRDCRRFVEGLALLKKTPPPAAPPELVDAIVQRGRMMAEAGVPRAVPRVSEPAAEDGAASEDGPSFGPAFEPAARPQERDPWWRAVRLAAGAAAVAAAVFALVLSFQGFRALRPNAASTKATPTQLALPQASAPSAADSARSGAAAGRAETAASGGPRFIAVANEAYAWLGARTPDAASMVPLDAKISSSLDSSATPAERQAWRSKTDADIVFVRSDDTSETYTAFKRVVRTSGGKLYTLWAADITAYGQWPALPSQYATPTAEDGSPTFVPAGKDDSGLDIFAPTGSAVDAGFAVAPGTTPSDPAGGDPNWTWWVPKR
ncbi:MAG TPA: hypothetical protein VGK50_02470 [Coriobacteriia bacterium]|jgi:hypothetical protein